MGAITVPVYIGEGWKALIINVIFIVFDAPASYNTILERSSLNPHRMIYFTYNPIMKFPTPHDIRGIRGDQPMPHTIQCTTMC